MKVMLSNDNPLSEAYLRYRDMLEKSDKYDVIISSKDINSDILDSHRRILLIERLDGAAIWCRGLLKHPNVATLLKMYHYASVEVNNRPAIGGRVFIPDDGFARPQIPELTSDDLVKVKPGFSFLHYQKLIPAIGRARKAECKPLAQRKIMSFFAGTTEYDIESSAGRWITHKRLELIHRLNRLRDEKGLNIILAAKRIYTNSKYLEFMADTKVIFSPFGWGEFCYRDYEALLCGCVLVKPFMAKIAHAPDISAMWHDWSTADKFFNPALDWSEYEQNHEALIQAKDNERKILEDVLS